MNGTEHNEGWCIELFEMHYLGCYGDVCRYRRTRNLSVSLYFFFFLFSLSSVFTLCRIAFRGATKRYIMNSDGSEQNKVIFTHPTQCRRVWLRGLGDWLNSSPYSWIKLYSVSVDSRPRSFLFSSTTPRMAQSLSHMCASLSRSARCSLASSQISRRHNDSFASTEALSGMIFTARQKLSGIRVWTWPLISIEILKYSQHIPSSSFVLLLPSCCFCFVFAGENSKKSHLVTVFCRFWSFRALTAAVVILRLLIHFLFELKKMGRIISNSHFLCPSWRALITIKKNIYISRICALQPSTRFKDLSPQLLVRTTRTAII